MAIVYGMLWHIYFNFSCFELWTVLRNHLWLSKLIKYLFDNEIRLDVDVKCENTTNEYLES